MAMEMLVEDEGGVVVGPLLLLRRPSPLLKARRGSMRPAGPQSRQGASGRWPMPWRPAGRPVRLHQRAGRQGHPAALSRRPVLAKPVADERLRKRFLRQFARRYLDAAGFLLLRHRRKLPSFVFN